MVNAELTAGKRPGLEFSTVFSTEGENQTTREDEGRVRVFIVFPRALSLVLNGSKAPSLRGGGGRRLALVGCRHRVER